MGKPSRADYRHIHGISEDLGTACNVQMMVFGDLGNDSGSGVAFTRDPSSGDATPTATTCPTPKERTSSLGFATP